MIDERETKRDNNNHISDKDEVSLAFKIVDKYLVSMVTIWIMSKCL